MHRSSLAPELSATFKRVSCCITHATAVQSRYRGPREIADFVGWCGVSLAGSLGLLDDLKYAPAFLFGDGARFGDANQVADATLVLLVVDLELGALPDGLLVEAMRLGRADLDDHRLVHLV